MPKIKLGKILRWLISNAPAVIDLIKSMKKKKKIP